MERYLRDISDISDIGDICGAYVHGTCDICDILPSDNAITAISRPLMVVGIISRTKWRHRQL
jgi:hypothetical protein